MAYKRYIKKGGKVYGPYIYHSHKKDGKVVSKYLGKHEEQKKLKDFFKSSVKLNKKPKVSKKGLKTGKKFFKKSSKKRSSAHRSVYPKNLNEWAKKSASRYVGLSQQANKLQKSLRSGAKASASFISKSRMSKPSASILAHRPLLSKPLSRSWKKSKGLQPRTLMKKPGDHKINFSKRFLFLGLAGLFLLLCMAFLVNLGLTGKVALDVKSKYTAGEVIKGDLKFSLQAGELIPTDSILILNLGGDTHEFILSDLIDGGLVEGDFYAENTVISGTGSGYGLIGSKQVYPDVGFDLRIFDEGKESVEDETPVVEEDNVTEEEENVTGEEENVTEEEVNESEEVVEEEVPAEEETPEEIVESEEPTESSDKKEKKDKEKDSEPSESEDSSESDEYSGEESSESSESSDSDSSSSPITGAAVSESDEIVSGTVNKDEEFTYGYEKGKTAELIEGTVTVNGAVIDDGSVKVKAKNKKVVVSTKYFIEEKGFGEEYLGKKKLKLKIKLKQFGLVVENDSELIVKLVYREEILVEASKDLVVDGEGGEEVNETEVPETNYTQVNETRANVTDTNITIVNETVVNVTILDNVEINTTQFGAVLNKPVRWKKAVTLSEIGNVTVELPKEATNITVYMLDGEEEGVELNETEIEQNESVVESNETAGNLPASQIDDGLLIEEDPQGLTNESIVDANETEIVEETPKVKKEKKKKGKKVQITAQVISGEVSVEIELEEGSSVYNFFRNIFNTITGRVIDVEEKENVTEVVIDENGTEFEIAYETPAPVAFESNTSKGKDIVISSDVHYENILAFTELPKEVPASIVKLYWITQENVTIESNRTEEQCDYNNETNSTVCENVTVSDYVVNGTREVRELVNVTKYDLNNNSLVDYIEWVVPSLSNQSYELELSILNVQSYPTVGGNWTVRFNTTGTANLTINAYDGTTWINKTEYDLRIENNESVSEDLVYLETKCGPNSTALNYSWIDNNCSVSGNCSVLIQNYSCETTGYHTVKVLTPGIHNQLFEFGDQNASAHNLASFNLTEGVVGWWRFDDDTPVEMPDYGATTPIDMTGNVLLMHFDNHTPVEMPANMATTPVNMDGNVLLMHMDNSSSVGENDSLVYDWSGNGNNGTMAVGAPTFTTSRRVGAGAYEFDGDGDGINLGSDDSLDGLGPLTYSLWVKPNVASHNAIWMGKTTGWTHRKTFYSASSKLHFQVDGSTDLEWVSDWDVYEADVWQHYVVTWDGGTAASGVKVYKNGIEVTPDATVNGIGLVDDSADSFYIGARLSGPDYYFNGSIDEVAIWNRSLSADEISALYEMQKGPKILEDSSKRGATEATASGDPVFTTSSKMGNGAYEFDAVGDYFNLGTRASFDAMTEMTFSAWIKSGDNNAGKTILNLRSGASDQIYFDVDNGEDNLRVWNNIDAAGPESASSSAIALADKMHHVVWIVNSSNSTTAYYDGELVLGPTQFTTGLSTLDDGFDLLIGTIYGGNLFNGTMDEVALWNRTLSADEIKNLYMKQEGNFPRDYSGHCYDNETEILTDEGWKYFSELNQNEGVATLNSESGELEWQTPTEWQEFDNKGDMYRIETDEGDLVVSEKHSVYSNSNNSINSFVVNEGINDCSLKCLSLDQIGIDSIEANAKYVTSFGSEILEENSLIDLEYFDLSMNETFSLRSLIAELKSRPDLDANSSLCFCNSINAKSGANNFNENLETIELATLEGLANANRTLASTTNFILDYNNFSFSSCLVTPSLTSFPNSIHHSENPFSSSCLSLANISCFQDNCLALVSIDALTNLDQLISGNLFMSSLVSPGTDSVIDAILLFSVEKHKYVELFKSFDLEQITETYERFENGEEIYFLDENNKPVKVKSISKITDYSGKIYDVDVENDIVLVRRGESIALWSGNSNNGTVYGDVVWNSTDMKVGNGAYDFDGVGDYVMVNDMGSVEGVSGLAVSAWVKSTVSDNPTNVNMVSKEGGGDDTFTLKWYSNENVVFQVFNTTGGFSIAQFTDGIEDTNWHHIVGIYNGTNALVYVDGVVGGTAPVLEGATLDTAHEVVIGSSSTEAYFWNGSIDEVMIWNRSLSAAEVQQLYNLTNMSLSVVNLTIWDDSDSGTVYPNYTKFYADYSSGVTKLNGTNYTCEFRHNKTGLAWNLYSPVNMSFNSTSNLYELIADGGYTNNGVTHTDGMPVGSYWFNISCYDAGGTYQNISLVDAVTVSEYNTSLATSKNNSSPDFNEQVTFSANFTRDDPWDVENWPWGQEIGRVILNKSGFGSYNYPIRFFDYDGDGKKDEFLIESRAGSDVLHAYYSNGTEITADNWPGEEMSGASVVMEVGDLDGDGFENDLIIGGHGDTIRIFNGTGDQVQSFAAGDTVSSIKIGDLDNDGLKNDFVVGSYANKIMVFNTSDGRIWENSWNYSTGSDVYDVEIGDFDRDGYEDDVACASTSNTVSVFVGINGTLIFNTTLTNSYSVTAMDLNDDGYNDELVVGVWSAVRAFRWNGTWGSTMQNVDDDATGYIFAQGSGLSGFVFEIVPIDLDDDGKKDEFIASDSVGTVSAYNESGGINWSFTLPADDVGNILVKDINNDGVDEVVAGDSDAIVWVLNKSGDLLWNYEFSQAGTIGGGGKHPGLDVGDLNGDGINDLIALDGTTSLSAIMSALQDASCSIQFTDEASTYYNETGSNLEDGLVLLMHMNNDSDHCYDNETRVMTGVEVDCGSVDCGEEGIVCEEIPARSSQIDRGLLIEETQVNSDDSSYSSQQQTSDFLVNSLSNSEQSEANIRKCYKQTWKYFVDVEYDDEILTLNSTSGGEEYHKPFEIQNLNTPEFMYRIETEDGDLVVSPKHRVYASTDYLNKLSGYEINLNIETTNNLPLNSDGLTSLSNFDNNENVVSINGGVILNTTIPECSLGGNNFLLRKCLSNVNITLESDLDSLDNCLSDALNETFLTSYPFSLNNLSTPIGKFSSERNFNLFLEKNMFFFSDEFGSICQNRKDSRACELREIILNDFVDSDSCSKQFHNLPDHNSCSFECRSSTTNFSISNNELVNINSHELNMGEEIFKSFDYGKDNDSVSFVVMPEVFEEDGVIFKLECENEAFNMDSFEVIHWGSEVFEMVDEKNVGVNNLFDFFVNGNCKSFVFSGEFSEGFFQFIRNLKFEGHSKPINLSNLSKVNSECGPFSASFNSLIKDSFIGNSSTGCQSIASQNSLSSSVTSLVCLNRSEMSRFINETTALATNLESNSKLSSKDFINSAMNNEENGDYLKLSDKRLPARDGSQIDEELLIEKMPFNDNLLVNSLNNPLPSGKANFDLEDFSLEQISETYNRFNSGEEIYFLDREGNEIQIKDITKEFYSGRIYDVDVPNDIILVERDGLVVWSGNSENDTLVYDFSGNGNNGTSKGDAQPNLTNKKLGAGSFEFDGSGDDYVNAGQDMLNENNQSFTVSAWAYRHDADNYGGIVSKDSGNRDWFIAEAPNGEIRIRIYETDGGEKESDSPGDSFPINTWTHVGFIVDIENGKLYRIVNGVLTDITGAWDGTSRNRVTSLNIGKTHSGSDYTFDGSIDEVAVWNRSLSADEVWETYNAGAEKHSMAWNVASDEWEYNKSFSTAENITYGTLCEKGGYETSMTTGSIDLTSSISLSKTAGTLYANYSKFTANYT
ncbi:hypothetical protein GOV13_04215, partial [Candidatus Pacearchaeota archaeon]|nr:hypothetical protein [Candidatus Pacearchaeota archaeon]